MRNYSPLAERLDPDAGNIAGLLAGMSFEDQQNVEKRLTEYVRPLPEKDINRIWAEKVRRFESDAMLYCEEEWVNGEKIEIDARICLMVRCVLSLLWLPYLRGRLVAYLS